MSAALSRRAALGAVLAAPMAAATCARPIVAAVPPDGLSARLSSAIAAVRSARHNARAFDRDVFLPAWEAFSAERDAIPHANAGPDPFSGRNWPVHTSDERAVKAARKIVRDVHEGRCVLETARYPDVAQHWDFCQRLSAAADERDALIAAANRRHRADELEAQSDALDTAYLAALNAMIATPATTVADLNAKIEEIAAEEATEWEESWAAIRSDAARLAGRA